MSKQAKGKLDFLKLLDQPFDNTCDTRFFFESRGHAEALSRLLFLVQDQNMGIGMLTGEIGCGKTMTRMVLRNRLDTARYCVVSIENCLLEFDDLLLEIISQMQAGRVYADDLPDRYARLVSFKNILAKQVASAGKHLVLLLDEAQLLSPDGLDCVKGLTNIASEKRNFLSLIIIGQPELRDKVKRKPQVDQRIGLRYHLNPLSLAETEAYLTHRLRAAGLDGTPPFTDDAVKHLAEVSQGIPRQINRICKLALDHAIANGLSKLDVEVVGLIADDIHRQIGNLDASFLPA
ncbi:MAG: AAA family ATPase [Mariprofundaceae bacterium]